MTEHLSSLLHWEHVSNTGTVGTQSIQTEPSPGPHCEDSKTKEAYGSGGRKE
jgi:hypothetical protein